MARVTALKFHTVGGEEHQAGESYDVDDALVATLAIQGMAVAAPDKTAAAPAKPAPPPAAPPRKARAAKAVKTATRAIPKRKTAKKGRR